MFCFIPFYLFVFYCLVLFFRYFCLSWHDVAALPDRDVFKLRNDSPDRDVFMRLAGRRDHLPDVGDREPRRPPDSASLVRKRPSRAIFFVTVFGGVAVKRFPVNGSTSSRGYHRRRRASMLAYHNNNDNIDNDNNTNINNNRRSLTKTNVIITPRS